MKKLLVCVCVMVGVGMLPAGVRAQDSKNLPGVAASPGAGLQVPASEVEFRRVLGIGEAGGGSVWRVGVRMAKSDADQFDAWQRDWSRATSAFGSLIESGAVFGGVPDLAIAKRSAVVFADPGALDKATAVSKSVAGWQIDVRPTPVPLARMRGVAVELGRVIVGEVEGVPPGADTDRELAASVVAAFRASNVELFDVHLSFAHNSIDLVAGPKNSEVALGIVAVLNKDVGSSLFGVQPGTRSTPSQATSEARPDGGFANFVRGGKTLFGSIGGQFLPWCTTGPTLQSGNQRFVVTAGHCFNGPTNWRAGSFNLTLVPGTVCNVNCGAPGVDAALLTSDFNWTSHEHLHQADGAWNGLTQAQGQTYRAPIRGVATIADNTFTNWICNEGASHWRYDITTVQGLDGRTVCGVSMSHTFDGFQVAHIYGNGSICLGDSGGLVRIPDFTGGSLALGVLSRVSGFRVPGTPLDDDGNIQCFMRSGNSPAWIGYSEINRIVARFNAVTGLALTVQTTT